MDFHIEMLRKVSRTFALSIEQLPDPLRDSIAVAYLLFRISDSLEDHCELASPEKARLLRRWADVLAGECSLDSLTSAVAHLDASDPEIYLTQNADRVFELIDHMDSEVRRVIVGHVIESSLGMARWQDHGPYVEDEAALDDYMHQVAGRVGYLLTDVFSWYSPIVRRRRDSMMPLARECGLALQTVNIIRGMRKDYERGWVFVPQSFYRPLGLTRETLFAPDNLDKALLVVDRLADKAEGHLWHGLSYVLAFPRREHRIRLACIWPVLFAARTLAISRRNANVLLNEAKMGRDQVARILVQTKLMGWSNRWLSWYYFQLAKPAFARPA